MTPREIIAQALAPSGEGATSVELMFSDAILEALTSSGCRILGPGELDPETVERCAEEVEQTKDGCVDEFYIHDCDEHATAIRALAKEKQGC